MNKSIIFLLQISLILSGLMIELEAQTNISFQRILPEQGFPLSIVESIMQDQTGFMWFGTEDGLYRFDGYNFTALKNNPNDINSLSYNHVTKVYEDKLGKIWIGTYNGGLNRFDPRTGQFQRFQNEPSDHNSLSHNIVNTIYEDNSGTLWIGTERGLNILMRSDSVGKSSIFTRYINEKSNSHSLSNNTINAINEDLEGGIWIGTDRGLNKLNPENKKDFTHFLHDSKDPTSLSNNSIRTIFRDKEGTLWIGTDRGLNKLILSSIQNNPSKTKVKFVQYLHDPKNPHSLSHNEVYAIYEDQAGSLWIGTNGGGLNKFNKENETFTHYLNNPRDPNSLSHNEIRSIYEDRAGILWIGTYGGSICHLDQAKKQFAHYKSDPDNPNSLSENIVWCIHEDREKILWIGTHGGGLNKFDREKNKFIRYLSNPGNKTSLSNNIVRSILEDRSGDMWIGTHGGGLNRFDRDREKFTNFQQDPNNPKSLSHNEIRALHKDRFGTIWIGTRGGGLNKLIPSEQQESDPTFIHYRHDVNNLNSISSDFIRVIFEDMSGRLWVGTLGGGLNKFDRETNSFEHFRLPNNLSSDFIFSIHQDKAGILWLGTWGGGLNRFDPSNGSFKYYIKNDGLSNNSIYGILEDTQGNLWLSTNSGLSRFNPKTETFRNYSTRDGLQSNEFNGGSYFISSSGEMFFGGTNGFNAFFPEEIKDNLNIPPIVITSFQILKKEKLLDRPVWDMRELELSYKDYVFSFEFAALDFTAPDKNRYAYMMEGLDEEWFFTDSEKRFANYTTLPPGEYIFHVKGSNNDGIWNEKGTSIKITITPPFWNTIWFRILIITTIIYSVYALYRKRIRKIEANRKNLEIRVKEKTESAESLQNALHQVEILKNRLQAENIYLKDEIKVVHNFENIITRSESHIKVLHKVEQVASTDATVLILGESGTGKELITRAVHNISNRGDRPLVKVNCSALPANLIESELFGHEKGAFTGAIAQKIGRFELADNGTIFLDEIGDLPIELQAKLLRVLQEGEFERLGNPKTIKVDVRVIAATNRNLEKEIENGNFREDLYYRLNVFPILIPPLRERNMDIPLLVNYFVNKYGMKIGKTIEEIPQSVLEMLQSYNWPGNVRELENIIERAVIISKSKILSLGDWLPKNGKSNGNNDIETLEENEKQHILKSLELTGWRISGDRGAANILGINPKTLESRIRKLEIKRKK